MAQVPLEVLTDKNARAFRDAVKTLLTQDAMVALDLSSIQDVDSTGLNALVSCLRQASAVNAEIKVFGLSPPVRVIFQLVRMHHIFEIFNTGDEAVSSYLKSQ